MKLYYILQKESKIPMIIQIILEKKVIDIGVRLDTIEKASGVRKSGHPLGTWVEKTDKKLHLAGGQRL